MSQPRPPRPAIADPRPWSFPVPVRGRLDNGLATAVHHLPGQHVVSATLVLDHSSAVEPTSREGITALLGRTLTEGTEQDAGERFAELLATIGAAMGTTVTHTSIQVMIDVPADRLPEALGLLADAVRRPALTDADVGRQVVLRRAEIAQLRANSAATAGQEYRRLIIDPAARAGRPVGGEDHTVADITGAEVRDFHRRWFGPARSTLIVGGDLPSDPTPMIDQTFASWSGEAGLADHPPTGPAAPTAVIIDRPGAVQADIRLGGWAVDRADPRWPALRVATHLMGGSFGSRLNHRLREELGYTYGVGFAFTPFRSGGQFSLQGSFRTEVVGAALGEAVEILDIASRPFTDAEVLAAQNHVTGITPLQYGTADAVVDQTALQQSMGLPDDYLARSTAAVLAVTPEKATAAYASLVDPAALTLVVVGDAAALQAQVAAAGFDATVTRTED